MVTNEDYKRFVIELLDWAKYNTNHVNNKYRKCYVIMKQQIESDIINILQKEPEDYHK